MNTYAGLYAWLKTMREQADARRDLYYMGKASAYNDVILFIEQQNKEGENPDEEYTINELTKFSKNKDQ